MELICGACHGRLLVEQPGTTVACPHCGTHLQTLAPTPAAVPETAVAEAGIPAPGTMQHSAVAEGTAIADHLTSAPSAAGHDPPIDPLLAGQAAFRAADTVPPALPNIDPLLAGQTAFRAADTVPPPLTITAGGDGQGAAEVVVSTGEEVDNPHKTTVVEFAIDVSGLNPRSPSQLPDESPAESTVPAAAPPDGGSAVNPRVEITAPAETTDSSAISLAEFREAETPPPPSREPSSSVLAIDKSVSRRAAQPGISPRLFMIVVSYASAVTLACLYLAFQLFSNPRTHDLPDLAPQKPKDKKKGISLMYISPEQELLPANMLKLGESRRFGSLKVTPLRVTRGPLEFEYYDPAADQHKDPEGPVLKLHLRFENISSDQEFVPLDSSLVFYRKADEKAYGSIMANNFVCNVADRKDRAKQVLAFDLTPNGNWLVKGENLDKECAPGQVIETFIPTTAEQIETLSGDLVWRVHFRKGYNRSSYRGVTTLIEVFFKAADIIDEQPSATGQPNGQPDHGKPAPPANAKPAVKDA